MIVAERRYFDMPAARRPPLAANWQSHIPALRDSNSEHCFAMTRALLFAVFLSNAPAQEVEALRVGVQSDGRVIVPTNQVLHPAGQQVEFPGRPVDLLQVEGGRLLVAKNLRDLTFVDPATGQVRQTLATPGTGRSQPGFSVAGLAAAGDRVFASDALHSIRVARRGSDGAYVWEPAISVPSPAVGGEPQPAGLGLLADGKLAVTTTRGNCVHFVDVTN